MQQHTFKTHRMPGNFKIQARKFTVDTLPDLRVVLDVVIFQGSPIIITVNQLKV